jgi:DNA-binding response OmpR family regulator
MAKDMTAQSLTLAREQRRRDAGRRPSMQIAVLDVDSGFVHVLDKRLQDVGAECRVTSAPPSPEALAAMRVHALVIDPTMLGTDAWPYLERLCSQLPQLGVLICTRPSALAERVRGLRLGVDDWVTKPCHPEEVVARLEAVVRCRRPAAARATSGPLVVGELEIHPTRFQAYAGGVSAELTRREFELVQLLAEADGLVLRREEIYERVWGYSMVRGDRSVDVFVRKLRQKLERVAPGRRYIHTHFGIGYRLAAETPPHAAEPPPLADRPQPVAVAS